MDIDFVKVYIYLGLVLIGTQLHFIGCIGDIGIFLYKKIITLIIFIKNVPQNFGPETRWANYILIICKK